MNDCSEDVTSVEQRSRAFSLTRDNRQPHEKQLAVNLILASTLFERIAFYIISVNLVPSWGSATSLAWSTDNSSVAVLIFSSVNCVFTLLFGILTDAKSDRFKVIIIGFFIYIVGYIIAIVGTSPSICYHNNQTHSLIDSQSIIHEQCAPWIIPALIIIGIAAGATQSNMPVFGAEQIEEPRATSRYFNKHVLVVCLAAASSKLVISYIQDKDPKKLYTGYIIAIIMLLISMILFTIRHRYYLHIKPYNSVVTKFFPVMKNAFRTWRKYKTTEDNRNSIQASSSNNFTGLLGRPSAEFLDFAKITNHGKFPDWIVDDVKSFRRLSIVFCLLIPYWIIYDQVYTSFPAQRRHMQMPANVTYKTIISTLVSFGDPVIILIGLFICNVFLYNYIRNCNQVSLITMRFVIGMCFGSLSMFTSGFMEILRQQGCDDDHQRTDFSIFYQIPQNALLGLSKLLVLIASYEYAYLASRRSGRSFFMGTDASINFVCEKDHIWYWSFYTYFYILAGIQLIFVIIFIICNKKFHLIKLNSQLLEET